MPVVWRGDEHRINVRTRQEFAVVVDGRATGILARAALRRADFVCLTRARLAAGAGPVAHGDQLGFLVAREDVQMPAAHGAAANETDVDALAGGDGAVAAARRCRDDPRHRQQRSGYAAPEKGAAGQAWP